MPTQFIDPEGFAVGKPLPCNVYDAKGMLLLRRGQIISNQGQLDKLLAKASLAHSGVILSTVAPERPALGRVLEARERLQALLEHPLPGDFIGDIDAIAEHVRKACETHPDVTLASILLCQEGPYAARHAVNAAIACQLTGRALGLDGHELASTVAAALTMNIGMFELQEGFRAQEAPLSEHQRAQVRNHCQAGVACLREHGVTSTAWLNAVRDHHERADGSGYPSGKRGDEIGRPARLLALADVYCARVSGRDYRPAMRPTLALRWLFLNEGAVLDDYMTKVFIKTLGIYPPGTGVRLRNGTYAIVTGRGATSHQPPMSALTTYEGLRTPYPLPRRPDVEAFGISDVVDLAEVGLTVDMEALWGDDARS